VTHPLIQTVTQAEYRRSIAKGLDIPISLLVPRRDQPAPLRRRASRVGVRASRSLPYPDGRYERRRQQREEIFDRRVEAFEGEPRFAPHAYVLARKGSGRLGVVD
jgi:hypothetical protein